MAPCSKKISKRHLKATVLFATTYIPNVDQGTLEKFLDLVNATGNFGAISDRQLIHHMYLLMKHVPNTCKDSLCTLSELLDIAFPYAVSPDRFHMMEETRQ